MNANKQLWEKGDFSRIADSMRDAGSALVAQLGIQKGLKVLDLGCGDGNTAIPEARLGAEVTGVDISTPLVAAAKRRAQQEGLTNVSFQEGDATDLRDLPDRQFDLAISIFGAMFAPRPFDVAKEMIRVTRSGGRVVMGNWIPGDPTMVAQLLKICSGYTAPPPEGFISPMLWGVENHVVERFTAAGVAREDIACEKEIFNFSDACTPAEYVDKFRKYYGPTMNAFEAAEQKGRASALQSELEGLFERENRSGNSQTTFIPATYLKVTVRRR
jgi:ubiquinone/menaquinone biosynthesis C-methylase UbiE